MQEHAELGQHQVEDRELEDEAIVEEEMAIVQQEIEMLR
jgi:hypothetical protein